MSPDAPLPQPNLSPSPSPIHSPSPSTISGIIPPRPHWTRRAPGRLLLSVIMGTVGYFVVRVHVDWHIRAVVGWDIGALTQTLLTWRVIIRSNAKATAAHAAPEDPGGTLVWVVALFASMFSLFAATFVLRVVHHMPRPDSTIWTALGLLAVALSWILTHTAYTMRYAHLYYRRGGSGGLDFPGGRPPCDFDFAYFAFTLGMCFQVSDVTISASHIRRVALLHGVISFIYNTTILALALNVAFGSLG